MTPTAPPARPYVSPVCYDANGVAHDRNELPEFNPLVSFFPDAYENLPTDIPASQFIASIKSNQHKARVEEIRERFNRALSRGVAYSQAKRVVDSQKKKLASVTFAGVVPMRDKKTVPQFTGLVQADLDLLGDRLEEIRATLREDPHVYQQFKSPTGEGLKAIYRVPICQTEAEYLLAFAAVKKRVLDLTGVTIDELPDFTRLCFASWDPDADHNPHAIELPVDFSQAQEQPQTPAPTPAPKTPASNHTAPVRGESRKSIVERILGTVEWESGVLGHCACPGEASHTTGEKTNECRIHLDKVPTVFCVHKSCAPAIEATNFRLRSEIGTAEYQPTTSHNTRRNEYIPTEEEVAPVNIGDRLAAVRFNILTPPPQQVTVFETTAGATIATKGNIGAITAKAKAGKSAWIAALIAAGITPRPDDCDLLGVRAVNPEGLPVLLLDTEHSPFHHHDLCDRILRRAMLTESDQLHAYQLAGFSVAELNASLEHLLAERKWLTVVLDGTGDFVADVNDPKECNARVARFHGLAIAHDTHMLNVLHLNPASETKSRGHLGSQLERKSETNLRIEKTDGVSVVFSDKNRGADIPKNKGPRFTWSHEKQMHVSVATIIAGKDAAKTQKLREQAEEAYRLAAVTAFHWKDFIAALRQVPGIGSDSTASRIYSALQAQGIIKKNVISQWEIAPQN